MSKNLGFDFNVNKESKSITIRKEFAAGLALVWEAYTRSEYLDQWWAPKPWKARTKSMDFKEGGQWHYAMVSPEGDEHWSLAQYKKIEPLKKFTGLDAFADEKGQINKALPESYWEVSFEEKGGITVVNYLMTFNDLAQLETTLQMGFKEGMTSALEGLEVFLAGK